MRVIEVTAEHIRYGVAGSCKNCPVALALKAHFQTEEAFAGPSDLRVGMEWWETPDEVGDFMDRFDEGQPVSPFSFALRRQK